MATVRVNGNVIEPASQQEGGRHFAVNASQTDYLLLHCAAQLSNAQHAQLANLRVGILEYIATNTYLCQYKPHDLEAVRALPFVVYANVYHHELVISSGIRSKPSVSSALATKLDAAADSETQSAAGERETTHSATAQAPEPIRVAITLHQLAKRGPLELKQHLEDLLNLSPDAIQVVDSTICLPLRPEDLTAVARIDEVQSIDEIHPTTELCTRARIDLQIPARMAGVAADVLDGAGELVAVMEGKGCDVGDQAGLMNPRPFHPALNPALAAGRWYWKRYPPNPLEDVDGHGTLVTGCVVANGRIGSRLFGTSAKGTASGAAVLLQARPFPPGGVAFAYADVFDSALNRVLPFRSGAFEAEPRAYIHNNSFAEIGWREADAAAVPPVVAGPIDLAYNPNCRTIDTYLNEDRNRNLLVVWAAGNDGMHPGTRIGSQPASKNVLTVGACESSHPLTIDARGRYQIAQRGRGNPNNMAWFSTPGPANGRVGGVRIKPDVVAPGIVLSCRSTQQVNLAYWANANPPPPFNFDRVGHSPDDLWNYAEGTSFAAPFVSGMLAVIRRSLRDYRLFPAPSSGLLKALVIHGAVDLQAGPGASTGGPVTGYAPNNLQGWGRANLTNSLSAIMDLVNCNMINTSDRLQQGQRRQHYAHIPLNRTATLIATMTFIDRPSDVLQSTLLLSVVHTPTAGGPVVRRYANRNASDPAMTAALLRTADLDNNVQKIIWPNMTAGVVECEIEARFVVPSAPGLPLFPGQDYVIVWQLVFA